MAPQIMINDCQTGESYLRDMTEEEIAQQELDLLIPKVCDDLAS